MPDKKNTLPASQYDALLADDDSSAPAVNIDIPNLKEEIAAHESKGVGDYDAENDTSSAKGRYQFMWSRYGNRIKKETGVKDSDEFLANHDAQDKFFDSYAKSDVIPWVQKVKEGGNTRGLSDKQLAQLYHFIGPGGAEKYLSTGKYDVPGQNATIDNYLQEKNPVKTLPADQYDALFADDDVQKKSPVVSADGSANSSLPGQNGSSQNSWDTPQATLSPNSAPTQGVVAGVNGNVSPQAANPTLPAQTVLAGVTGNDINGQPLVSDQTQAAANPATLPFTNIPVNKAAQTPDEVKEETGKKAAGLGKFIVDNVSRLPAEYKDNMDKIPFTDSKSIVNDLTDPHGQPDRTGQILQHGLGLIKQDELSEIARAQTGENNPYTVSQEIAAIKDKYAKQAAELSDNASGIIKLQVFNKEYNTKPLTDAEANTKVETLNKQHDAEVSSLTSELNNEVQITKDLGKRLYTSKKDADPNLQAEFDQHGQKVKELNSRLLSAGQDLQNQLGEVNNNTKYNPIKIGAEYQAMLGNKTAANDLQALQQGKPIDPSRQYQYNIDGRDVIQTGNKNAAANGTDPATNESTPHLDITGSKVIANNKPYLIDKAAMTIGNAHFDDMGVVNSLGRMIVPSQAIPQLSEADIEKYGKDNNIPDYLINELKKDPSRIPKSASIPQKIAQGAMEGVSPAASTIYKNIVYPALGGQDFNDTHQRGWEGSTGAQAAIVGNTPTIQDNTFHSVTGALGQMGKTIGSLSMLAGGIETGAAGLGDLANMAPKVAHTTAEFGVMGALGYNDGYNLSKEVIGDKPEDEWKRQLFAVTSGITSASLFTLAPSTKLLTGDAKEAATNSGEEFLKALDKEGGPEFLNTPSGKELLTKYIVNVAKEDGKQVGLMTGGKLAQNIINKIANPQRKQDLTDGLATEAAETSVTMLLPSIIGAAGHIKNQTPLNAATLFEAGSRPDKYINLIGQQLADGKITPQQAQTMHEGVLTMKSVIDHTPTANDDDVPLTPDQVKDYSFSLFQQHFLQKKLDALTEGAKTAGINVDKAQINPINKKINDLQSQREKILKTAGVGRPPLPETTDINSEQNPERSVATDAQTAEETPAAKKSSENVVNSEKNDIPLSSDNNSNNVTSQENVIKNENSNQEGRQSSTISNEGQESPNAKSAANSEGRNEQQEAGQLNSTDEAIKEKAVPATEPPLSVSKKKKRVQEDDEDQQPVKAAVIPIIHTPELQTRDDGAAKGQPEATTDPILKEAAVNHPELPIDHALTDKATGESQDDFTKRISGAMDAISKPESEGGAKDNAAIVTHSNVVKLLLAAYDKDTGKFDFSKKGLNEDYTKQSTETGNEYNFKIKDADGNEKNLKVIRHGESESGAEGKQREDNDQLTPEGKQEAVEVAEKMKADNELPSEIHTSTLPRAEETAQIIQEELAAHVIHRGIVGKESDFKPEKGGFYSPDKEGAEGYANGVFGRKGFVDSRKLKPDAKILKLMNGNPDNYSPNEEGIKEYEKITGTKLPDGDITEALWDQPKTQAKLKAAGYDAVIGTSMDGYVYYLINHEATDKLGPQSKSPADAIADKQIGQYNAVHGKKWADQIRLKESAEKRVRAFDENIKKQKEGTKKYNDLVNQNEADKALLKHIEEKPPRRSNKNQAKRGDNVTARVKSRDELLRKTPVTVEEWVKQQLLGMDDKRTQDKFSLSSVENDLATRKGSTERQAVGQFAHKDGKVNIDQWANAIAGDPKTWPEGLNLSDEREIIETMQPLLTNYESKGELQRELSQIFEDREQAEKEAEEAKWNDRSDTDYASDEYVPISRDELHRYLRGEDISGPAEIIDATKLSDKDTGILDKYLQGILVDGKVDFNKVDVFGDEYQEAFHSLSEDGREALELLYSPEHSDTILDAIQKKQNEKNSTRVTEEISGDASAGQGEDITSRSGENENGTGRQAPEGTEQQNSALNPERSVATDAQSAPQPPAAKKPLSHEEQLKIEKTSLKNQVEEGKKAEKERIAALKSKDPDAIQAATKKVNEIKDIVLKKQEKISRLEEKQREEEIKEKYNETADKWEDYANKLREKNKARKTALFGEGAEVSTMGFPGISDDLLPDFISLAAKALKKFGNVNAAAYHAWHELQSKFADVKEKGSLENVNEYGDMLRDIYNVPKQTQEPVLKIDNEEEAKAVIDNINKGMPYHEAIKPIMEDDEWTDKTKNKIINYIDWHNGEQTIHNSELAQTEAKNRVIEDYSMMQSDAMTRLISGETIERVTGDKPMGDQEAIKLDLSLAAQDSRKMVSYMKQHFGNDITQWGPEMQKQIDGIPPGETVKRASALLGLMDELRKDRGIYEYELSQLTDSKEGLARRAEINKYLADIPKMIKKAEGQYQETMRNASKTLNVGRNMQKLWDNHYAHGIFTDEAVLSKGERDNKNAFVAKEDGEDVSDKVAKEGVIKNEGEADKQIAELQDKVKSLEDKVKSLLKEAKDKITGKKRKDREAINRMKEVADANLKKNGMTPENMFDKIKELIHKVKC